MATDPQIIKKLSEDLDNLNDIINDRIQSSLSNIVKNVRNNMSKMNFDIQQKMKKK